MRNYKSRLQQVETQKSIKSSVIYGGLTIVIIIISLVFGIPLFSKFINLFSKPSAQTSSQNEILVPPTISTLPQYTNKSTLQVTGTAKPNTNVKIFFANSSDETTSDDSGSFSFNIGLTKGANTVYAKTESQDGNLSESSNSFIVNYSTQDPSLTIYNPQNNQTFYGDSQKTLSIQGLTDAGNTVTINDRVAIVDGSGKFNLNFDLQNGDNDLKIISLDQAGNKKEIDLKVTFNP